MQGRRVFSFQVLELRNSRLSKTKALRSFETSATDDAVTQLETRRFDLLSPSFLFFSWRDSPLEGLGLLIHKVCFLDHTRHTTVGSTPLDE
jgi:hypothetical protein